LGITNPVIEDAVIRVMAIMLVPPLVS
jgi:hypothetical protein